jgi:hypothetical protein
LLPTMPRCRLRTNRAAWSRCRRCRRLACMSQSTMRSDNGQKQEACAQQQVLLTRHGCLHHCRCRCAPPCCRRLELGSAAGASFPSRCASSLLVRACGIIWASQWMKEAISCKLITLLFHLFTSRGR